MVTEASATGEARVSVGVPCYNRPDLLERALHSIQKQSYRNLEIIVSNNASPDARVEELCLNLAAQDKRIAYHKQHVNIGVIPNFEFVLANSSSHYFMWVADDDWLEPNFIATCVAEFEKHNDDVVLVALEAQYETPEGPYPYFPEGKKLRSISPQVGPAYVRDIYDALFGNLVYGLFRRAALIHNGRPLTNWIGSTLNEWPFLLLLASKGQLCSLDSIGLHKSAPRRVCQVAEWDVRGGMWPDMPIVLNFRRTRSLVNYFKRLDRETEDAVQAMAYSSDEQKDLLAALKVKNARHLRQMLMGWKPRMKADFTETAASIERKTL